MVCPRDPPELWAIRADRAAIEAHMTSTTMIRRVLARDPFCVIAGLHCSGVSTVADHRANRGSGGSSVLDVVWNLIGACVVCNGLKEDATGEYRAELERRGVRVLKAATNAQTSNKARTLPVLYPDGVWWVLLEDGTRIPEIAY